MTKKNYEAAAKLIREWYFAPRRRDEKTTCANLFADFFAADNAKFDRVKFLKACGL